MLALLLLVHPMSHLPGYQKYLPWSIIYLSIIYLIYFRIPRSAILLPSRSRIWSDHRLVLLTKGETNMHSSIVHIVLASCLASSDAFTVHQNGGARSTLTSLNLSTESEEGSDLSRRELFQRAAVGAASVALVASSRPSIASASGVADGNLPDLPPEAQRSYLQYRIPLQIAADYYLWELRDKIGRIDDWGEVNELYRVNNNKGQGQPSRIERDYINPMRILSLSMPPDAAEEMRDAQFKFERAAAGLSKITTGVRRDLPVEITPASQKDAVAKWEEGRVALNEFFLALNTATGLNELKPVPPAGPNQNKEYGRSQGKYFDLMKKTKLCQNRGGPALSQAWGQLMVSGYLQDSCGIPDLDSYFYQ